MSEYMRRPEMFDGGPFLCYNCGRKLASKIGGSNYQIEFKCPKCGAFILVKTREPIPFILKMREKRASQIPKGQGDKSKEMGTTL